jgi:hypothetical protein
VNNFYNMLQRGMLHISEEHNMAAPTPCGFALLTLCADSGGSSDCTIQCQYDHRTMNCVGCRRGYVLPSFGFCVGVCLERLRKTTKIRVRTCDVWAEM